MPAAVFFSKGGQYPRCVMYASMLLMMWELWQSDHVKKHNFRCLGK